MYDLPSEDPKEPGLPDQFHEFQPQLLRQTFAPPHCPATRRFVAADMNLYYDVRHPLHHKRPDWFAVVDVPSLYEAREMRLSYVVWQEQVIPYLVVELLSPGTEKEDLGQTGPRVLAQPPTKWEVYEQILKVPYYVVYGRQENQMQAFVHDGVRYRTHPAPQQRLWLPEIDLGIGVWHGRFAEVTRRWLRFFDTAGIWVPTLEERAEQERARAEQERARAEQEREAAQRYREKLSALGIDPDSI